MGPCFSVSLEAYKAGLINHFKGVPKNPFVVRDGHKGKSIIEKRANDIKHGLVAKPVVGGCGAAPFVGVFVLPVKKKLYTVQSFDVRSHDQANWTL